MPTRTKILAGVLALFVILGGVYYFYLQGNSSAVSVVTASGAPGSDAEVLFLDLSSRLDNITFNTDILKDPRFTALVDIHTAVLPESVGRHDPFGSISGASSGS